MRGILAVLRKVWAVLWTIFPLVSVCIHCLRQAACQTIAWMVLVRSEGVVLVRCFARVPCFAKLGFCLRVLSLQEGGLRLEERGCLCH